MDDLKHMLATVAGFESWAQLQAYQAESERRCRQNLLGSLSEIANRANRVDVSDWLAAHPGDGTEGPKRG